MLARLRGTPIIFAMLAAVVLSVIAFAGFRHALGLQRLANAPVPYQPVVMRFTPPVARVVSDEAASGLRGAETNQLAAGGPPLAPPQPPQRPRGPSQLIRTANINLEVKDVTSALRDASFITDEQLGDVIGLNDNTPSSPNDPHTATMAIRVPQYRFEHTLDALGRLGKVTSKSVNAQDVSDQIIDAQARLRNLRRTETDMLGIMDRSGNIDQVLNVTQQISSVREQIERLDAQIQGMQYQVAYSTINISMTTPAVVSVPTGFAVLGKAWQDALASLRDLTVALLSIGLWIVAFSPYILGLALLAMLVVRRVRSHPMPTSGA